MKRLLLPVFLLGVIASSACCGLRQTVPQTGTSHCSGWSDQVRALADNSWQYAQLSQNVYANDYDFNLEDRFELIEEVERPDISYYSALFRNTYNGEYVFVFRGTDSFQDFKTGNNPFRQIQNELALEIVTEQKERYSIKKFIVTGHSLGGGIATHVSLNIDNATLYTFNGSPVFKQENEKTVNQRYSIVEKGEILKIVRALGPEPDQLYTSIECTSGNAIAEHSMKKLAICLTQISAVNDNQEAIYSLKINGLDMRWCKEN